MQVSSTRPNELADPTTRLYQQRRSEIAALLTTGEERPFVEYLPYEDEVWRIVSLELAPLHRSVACAEFNVGVEALALGYDGVPQLVDVSDRLTGLTGFHLKATSGIAFPREFYGILAERGFLAAQFVRDADAPYFSEDPDVLHELIGHANSLASPRIAAIYETAGRAFSRLVSETAVEIFSRLFWFTFESGVLYEDGEIKVFGASLLSSVTELTELGSVKVRDVEALAELVTEPYEIRAPQPTLFAFRSFDHLEDTLLAFYEQCDEDSMMRFRRDLALGA